MCLKRQKQITFYLLSQYRCLESESLFRQFQLLPVYIQYHRFLFNSINNIMYICVNAYIILCRQIDRYTFLFCSFIYLSSRQVILSDESMSIGGTLYWVSESIHFTTQDRNNYLAYFFFSPFIFSNVPREICMFLVQLPNSYPFNPSSKHFLVLLQLFSVHSQGRCWLNCGRLAVWLQQHLPCNIDIIKKEHGEKERRVESCSKLEKGR